MSELDAETFDAQKRRLCPDGTCVGLLDDVGRCRTCGRQGGAEGADEIAAWETGPDGPDSGHHTGEHDAGNGLASAGFDPTRRLCPNGECVGVLDAQGRCKECGRAEAVESPAAG